MHSGDLGKWRAYFNGSNSTIFDVIDNAILVAALDHPNEFKIRKEQIALKLLTCNLVKCSLCEDNLSKSSRSLASASAKESRVNWSKNQQDCNNVVDCFAEALSLVNRMTEQNTISSDMHGEEEHLTNPCCRHHKTQTSVNRDDEVKSENVRHTSMSSSKMAHGYRQAQTTEAKIYETAEENHLILEIEEDNETLQEAIKINKVLGNSQAQNDLVITELLQKLQGMDLNIQILKATMIGATVTALRKHGSKQVRKHARALISKWRAVADEWIEAQETNSGDKISDNCPRVDLPQPRLPHNLFNGGVPTTPTHSPLSLSKILKLFEDVDEKQFFSILPHDDAFAVMENLNKEQDSTEGLKLVEFEQDLKLLENTEIEKRITSEFDRKGKRVVGAQHQLKENTIKPLQGKECKDIQLKPKPSSFDTQKRATKHDIDDQLKQNTTNKPQVGLALKANECRNVRKRTQLNQAGDLAKTITSDIDQKPPRCSSYVSHQQKQNIVNTTQVILALPAQQYSGIHVQQQQQQQLSQSGDLKAKGVIHVQQQQQLKQNIASASQANHQEKLEEARKKLKAGYEDFENAKKRRAVKVIDPKDLKDLKRKYRKKHQIHI